jgi:E3 ubiquitin-protein ligase HERC2
MFNVNTLYICTGRGGSDGCKIPMKIDALYGQGVIKVECGSQFSVSLTVIHMIYILSLIC